MDSGISKYQNLITSLLLNAHFTQNIGLMHGKTGHAVLFYHLTRQTENSAFETFAEELIDDIIPVLSTHLPVDFENGLAGIGWGIEYLIQNHFLEADPDEVLEDFDKQIFLKFMESTPTNIGLLDGVIGTGHYFLMRVRGAKQKQKTVIAETNRIALQQICDHLNLMLSQPANLLNLTKEPLYHPVSINRTEKTHIDPVPVFEITWNLPVLIDFLTEMLELNMPQNNLMILLTRILIPLQSSCQLPILQCNRLLLLLSMIKLKNKLQMKLGNVKNEISMLTDMIAEKIMDGFDKEKYDKELESLNFAIRNGIPGIALIHQKLYEQTGDLEYKNEYSTLLNKFIPEEFVRQFRYDYSNPSKINEQQLGILQGIAGLLIASLR